MELRTHGLSIAIEFDSPDSEGWMWASVVADVPGFHGDYDFQLERANLELFRSQLAHAIDPAHWPCEVCFTCRDYNINLSFRVEDSGHIDGEYRFRSPGGATLTGPFEMDQTFLKPLLDQVDRSTKGWA